MASGGLEEPLGDLGISNGDDGATPSSDDESGGVQVTCFTEVSDDVTLHFQIIRLQKQVCCFSLLFSNSNPFFLSSNICPQFLHL